MPLIDTGHPILDDATHRRTWGSVRRALHQDIDRDQATCLDEGSVTIRAGRWLNSLNPKKLRRVAGPYILYPVPHGMDGPCPGLRTGYPPCGHPCSHALFQPLPPEPAPLPGIYLNRIPGTKWVHLKAGDTLGQAIPLHQVYHMAIGPRLTDTNKPQHPLAGHGAREPTDPNAPGPNRALLHLTMKLTAQLPTALEGHFFAGGLTDDVITLVANTLAAFTNTWDDAVGHPTARKDRTQEKKDILTPELMDQLLQLRTLNSPPEQCMPRIRLKVTDWTVLDHTTDGPTVTNTTLPTTWLTLAHNVAAYVRRHGMTQAQRWMSWPPDEKHIIRSRTDNL